LAREREDERERGRIKRGREKSGGSGKLVSGGKGGSTSGGGSSEVGSAMARARSLSLSPSAWCVSMRKVEIDLR